MWEESHAVTDNMQRASELSIELGSLMLCGSDSIIYITCLPSVITLTHAFCVPSITFNPPVFNCNVFNLHVVGLVMCLQIYYFQQVLVGNIILFIMGSSSRRTEFKMYWLGIK